MLSTSNNYFSKRTLTVREQNAMIVKGYPPRVFGFWTFTHVMGWGLDSLIERAVVEYSRGKTGLPYS